ncbi:MAG TPA: MoxR family ATPase [Desulfobacteraceae bacterium]|nr:MoxR family ATPase [Desulfobacteraceae bacterium]
MFNSIEEIEEALKEQSYITDRALATVIFLSHRLRKPLFLEGEPGVGKTEVAITMSSILNTRLIRLQCYEGLDVSTAVYEWNYPKQMIHLKILERLERTRSELEKEIYSEEFLIRRPLLEAIVENSVAPPILLIDEIDRADEEFEAFLLELLSDFQITIPEIGTIKAKERPNVIITSNRTRDIHDALKRRCLYHWIDYPSFEKEYMIIRARIPDIDETLAWQIANFMQALRKEDLLKRPGISETLDWARALIEMQKASLDEDVVNETLGCLLKYQEDIRRFKEEIWEDEEKRRHYLGI